KNLKRDQTVVLDLLATLTLGCQITKALTLQGCMEIANPSCRSANLRRSLHAARKSVFEQLRKIMVFTCSRRDFSGLSEDLDTLLSQHPLLCFNPVFTHQGGGFVPDGCLEMEIDSSLKPMNVDGLRPVTGQAHDSAGVSELPTNLTAKQVVQERRAGQKPPTFSPTSPLKMVSAEHDEVLIGPGVQWDHRDDEKFYNLTKQADTNREVVSAEAAALI
ncbi:unnamed protein product, partial [Amoebophrya sp. A120]